MGKLTLVEQALRLHKEYYGEDNFGTIVKDCDYYPKVAEIFINRRHKKRWILRNNYVKNIKRLLITALIAHIFLMNNSAKRRRLSMP